MKKKILFPQISGMIHGGDYNPDQWLDRPDILEEDLRLMKKAGVNCVSLGIFAWSAYEPAEGEFHFRWLTDIMDRLYDNGIYTVLATPSGARPAWLDAAYPEAMRVAENGLRDRHGLRHNHCMSSPAYREKVKIMDTRLAEAAGRHPGVILWHISNEFGGECYCPLCQNKFREYLKNRFHNNIEELNRQWWTSFWSHTYTDFSQIEPPFSNGERSVPGLLLEWRRFTTWNTKDFMQQEIDAVRRITPDIPVTTNLMELYEGLDYHEFSKPLDLVSWDSYPRYHNDQETLEQTAARTAFQHASIRGLKQEQPFLLMESTPSQVNWQPFNKLKRPGVHKLSCLQAVACGSDSVQYFQWRKGRGGAEQFHGAVMDHLGTDNTRTFREVAEVGRLLQKLAPVTGSPVKAQAAILYDCDNRWAIKDMQGLSQSGKQYEETLYLQYQSLMQLGVETDVISSLEDFSGYRLLAAPMLYLLHEGVAERLIKFVEQGGQLIATYLTGYVNEHTLCYLGGFPGGGLRRLFGLYSEEIDTLYPTDTNSARFADGDCSVIHDFAEILKLEGAEVLAEYTDDFYAGSPAAAKNKFGSGTAWYVGARLAQAGMEKIYRMALEDAGIEIPALPRHVEMHRRSDGKHDFVFYFNYGSQNAVIEHCFGTDLLTDRKINGTLVLPPMECAAVMQPLR